MYIGNVEINLQYYDEEIPYDEQQVEENLYTMLEEGKEEAEIVEKGNHYAVLHALSVERRNILEWYPFEKTESLLEIGSNCGALTGLFAERLEEVCVVEPSQTKAKVAASRNKNADNLKIVVGKMERICLFKKYDYISLVGTLENASRYLASPNPERELLENALTCLKEGGTLIVAVENRLGVKYWAGARERKTKRFFHGIEAGGNRKEAAPFSKQELTDLLRSVGLTDLKFYYPMPDYTFPKAIFSDERLPLTSELPDQFPSYYSDRLDLFDEGQALREMVKNHSFDVFANSFLVVCRYGGN